ncbi:MAG: hypothetical protein A2X49_02070 [Lentisphaerae bacterium GWF2_52_8]|nr:MAG: hypothetical protein A2X49_02070 [Lentisphaerae bacterium GWF2_52_8]
MDAGLMTGLSRKRMLDAFEYNNPDRIPVVYHPSPAGLHVHGRRLLDLFKEFPPDNPIRFDGIPHPSPSAIDSKGQYHEFTKDEWGTEWEYLIFGLWGHPYSYPFQSWEEASKYQFPPIGQIDKAILDRERRDYLSFGGGVSIFEKLCSLQPLDDVLVDIFSRDERLISFLDRLCDYWLAQIQEHLSAGVDVICFGDDWGTQNAPIISPGLFREVFKPRYKKLMEPIKKAGRKIFFHSCGYLGEILEELFELGIDGLWPQLPLFEKMPGIFERCRERSVAIYLHPDRQRLIPLGSPSEIGLRIQQYAERHRKLGGGGIFYVEIENDAPFENVEALIRAVHKYR